MLKKNFILIQKEFKKIAGFNLDLRQTNFLIDKIERRDNLFENLSRLYFDSPSKVKQLEKSLKRWFSFNLNEELETLFSLAGYIFYSEEDFKKAKKFFLKAISLNPDNYDNWRDLVFSLRHLGENNIAYGIFFNFDYIIHYYKQFRLAELGYKELKKLILKIDKETNVKKNKHKKN